jgi:putative methyltransferase (TIGR04325 family)
VFVVPGMLINVAKSAEIIPVVLMAYARPDHLRRVLACLRANRVPMIYAFLDGARGPEDADRVAAVRALVHGIDWCEVTVTERIENLGLGRNVLDGVSQVASRHGAFIVWEDDLVCVPGCYEWLSAALHHYAGDPRVHSVTGWTHPLITPAAVGGPYFDGRAECWVWGAYARSWSGMERSALAKMKVIADSGRAVDAYGSDLPLMAHAEARKNIWAVRWLYHHLETERVCLRPPWSMVEHIGFDSHATHSELADRWANPPLRPAPPIPVKWPDAVEHRDCRRLWQAANPHERVITRAVKAGGRARRHAQARGRAIISAMLPAMLRQKLRAVVGWQWFRGDYATWADARAASVGYENEEILGRVLEATLAVKAGLAEFERDGVLFYKQEPDVALMAVLEEVGRPEDGSLRVLDFGGSLGSIYWRHRASLPKGEQLQWDVVEQSAFVEAGCRYLSEPPLRFHDNVQEAQQSCGHDVLLCSGVLQYLEEPFRFLEEWSLLEIPYLLLNNLPLHAKGPDRIRVQHVPPSIYPATYPVWFFNREAFLKRVCVHYEIVKEFDAEAVWPVRFGMFQSTGLLLKRRSAS